MKNLDLYAVAEHLFGIEEATNALHTLYIQALSMYPVRNLLDVGCGRGEFLKRAEAQGIRAQGCDKSRTMYLACKEKGLDVVCGGIEATQGRFDAIVAIFDVLNFIPPQEMEHFLGEVALRLSPQGVFLADINTKHGFKNVAQGVMANQDDDTFVNVEANFVNDELHTRLTVFTKCENALYRKSQETITQYFHPIKRFSGDRSLRLIEKRNISLYDTNDKTLLVMQKR